MAIRAQRSKKDRALPLTVIGGYLGAGKTTLINRILTTTGKRRVAVLVNDFGALNIDERLIRNIEGETIALVNGCVCCTIGNNLGDALASLATQAFDHVLLEASGVADPARLGSMADTWPGYALSRVVVLVDATRTRSLIEDKFVGAHVRRQLAAADLLLVSKQDLLSESEIEAFRVWLQGESQVVARDAASFADVFEASDPAVTGRLNDSAEESHLRFESEAFTSASTVDRARFQTWAATLEGRQVRGKGFVRFTDEPEIRILVQIVDGNVSVASTSDDGRDSEMLLIARTLDDVGDPFAGCDSAHTGKPG